MRPIHLKIGLFVLLWNEMARCFQWSADAACIATLALWFGAAIVRGIGVELAGMSAPLTAAFTVRAALWLVVYFWLAPDVFQALPFSITAAGCVGLAFAGAWSREAFLAWLQTIDGQWFRDRSETIVEILIGVCALGFFSELHWGSVLPLMGYVLLPGLPLSFGWLAATPEVQWRFDAAFGSQDMFHDVGVSDEE